MLARGPAYKRRRKNIAPARKSSAFNGNSLHWISAFASSFQRKHDSRRVKPNSRFHYPEPGTLGSRAGTRSRGAHRVSEVVEGSQPAVGGLDSDSNATSRNAIPPSRSASERISGIDARDPKNNGSAKLGSTCHCRTLLAKTGRLLESVRHLQDAEVLFVAADDFDADGKSFGCEAAGYGGRGISGCRDIPAGFHPVDVAGEFHSGDFGRIRRVDVEWRQLRCG